MMWKSTFVLIALLMAESLTATIESHGTHRGSITGKVLEAPKGHGIPLVEVQIWNEAGEYLDAVLTDMDGLYSVAGLPSGRYFAATVESGFADTLFKGRSCPLGECDPTTGTPIEVSDGATTTDIDFLLQR